VPIGAVPLGQNPEGDEKEPAAPRLADFFGPNPLPQDRVGFFSFARRTTFAGLGAQGPSQEPLRVSAQSRFRQRSPSASPLCRSRPPRRNPIPRNTIPAILPGLLAVSTGMAVLRGGRRARYRRNNRHHADPAAHGGAALRLLRAALPTADLLRAAILRSAEFFRATLSPPVSRRWHSGGRRGGGIGSG
jgi:hypothetical protein